MEKGKILLVDDSPDNLLLLSDFLRASQYSVITANSGITALDIVLTERPDLLVLDVMMPGLSGYDVCRRVRDSLARIIHERFCCNRGFAAATSWHASLWHAAGGLAPRDLNILFQVCLVSWNCGT
jgi:response regulator RpfG family c-di-GMP phosphodiesterase